MRNFIKDMEEHLSVDVKLAIGIVFGILFSAIVVEAWTRLPEVRW